MAQGEGEKRGKYNTYILSYTSHYFAVYEYIEQYNVYRVAPTTVQYTMMM